MNKKKDEIEPWDDFNEIDLSKKRYVSDETRDKIRQSNTGKSPSPETRQRMSESRRGKKRSDAALEKFSESMKKVWSDPDWKKQQRQKLKDGQNVDYKKDFIKVHGDRYDYSKVDFDNIIWKSKIPIICKIHGEFFLKAFRHKSGQGCPKCARENASKKPRQKQEKVIEDFISMHGNRYDYSKVEYKSSEEKVIIICRIHGEFEQKPVLHKRGANCQICAREETNRNLKHIDV